VNAHADLDRLLFVSDDDPEWAKLWSKLEEKRGDSRELNLDTGDVWHYMHTLKHPLGYVHQFRHHAHPHTGRKIICNVVATRGWKPAPNQPANHPHYVEA
jgi:hypothetical protein